MLFRLAMFVVSGLVHYYVYRRIIGVLEPSKRTRWLLAAIVILMFLSIPLQTSARMWAPQLSAVMVGSRGPWLAFVGVSATYFAILDLDSRRRVARAQGAAPARTRRRCAVAARVSHPRRRWRRDRGERS